MTYTTSINLSAGFSSKEEARAFAQAVESLIAKNPIVVGGVSIYENNTFARVEVNPVEVDPSKYLVGSQAATSRVNSIYKSLTAATKIVPSTAEKKGFLDIAHSKATVDEEAIILSFVSAGGNEEIVRESIAALDN